MATRKSNEDGRGTDRGDAGEDGHPGSYVQVVGTPRRRKSSAKQAAVAAENSSNVERVGPAAAKYQKRLSDPPVTQEERERAERTFASPKKAMGPLGMESAPTEAAPTVPRQVPTAPGRDSLKKTALGMGPDMRAQLERYAAEQAEATRSAVRVERVHSVSPERPASEGRVRVLEVDASQGHIDTDGESDADATSAFSRSDIVVASQPAPAPLALRAPSEAPREASLPPGSMGGAPTPPARGEVASVFEARVSIRPSDPVQAQKTGPSWGMVIGIAVLSSIIASAGVVAMQQFLTGRSEREVPTVQVARRTAVAQPEPVAPVPAPVAPAPVVAAPVAEPEVQAAPVPVELTPEPATATPEPPVAVQVAPAAAPARAQPAARVQPRSPVGVKPRPAAAAPLAAAPVAEPAAAPAAPRPKGKNRLMGGLVEPGSEPSSPAPSAAPEEELPDNPFVD